MKEILTFAFGIGTLVDLSVSFIGFSIILGADSAFVYTIGLAMAFASVCIRVCWVSVFQQNDRIYLLLKWAFFISILLDFWTSMTALVTHALLRNPLWLPVSLSWTHVLTLDALDKKFILLLIGVYSVLSPIFISKLIYKDAAKK